jgi:hypothetical protein
MAKTMAKSMKWKWKRENGDMAGNKRPKMAKAKSVANENENGYQLMKAAKIMAK